MASSTIMERSPRLSVPGAISSDPDAINSWGEVAGTYLDSSGEERGFVYRNGTFTARNTVGDSRARLALRCGSCSDR